MSRLSGGGVPPAHAELYELTAEYVSRLSISRPRSPAHTSLLKRAASATELSENAVRFRKRAIDGAGKTDDLATLLDPTLVQRRHAEQKVSPYPQGVALWSSHQRTFRDVKHKYIEQEAKRAFLHAITGDAPEVVRDGEQDELATLNKVKKAKLKATKDEIGAMRGQALALSRKNAEGTSPLPPMCGS